MDYNISQSAFKFEIRRLIKRILEDVVRNSRLDRDETFRRICHVTSSGRLNLRTLNELDNAVLNSKENTDIMQLSTLIKYIIIPSRSSAANIHLGKFSMYDDVSYLRQIRNKVVHTDTVTRNLLVEMIKDLYNLAKRFEIYLKDFSYINSVYDISTRFLDANIRKHAILVALECYDLKQIRLNEDEDISDFTLSEFGDRRDDLKIGPIPPSLDDNSKKDVTKDAKRKVKNITTSTVDDENERCERNIDECEMYALPHRKHIESRRRTHYKEMTSSNTAWHIPQKEAYVKIKEQNAFGYLEETLDVCYVEEEGELKNYSKLKASLEEKVCGLTMMSSREISLPGRPVLPKLTQIKPALFLLQSKLISCSTAYQLRVGLKYHNKATFVLLSQLERSKMPSLQIRKSGLSVNYEYDLLLCYCPLDREKAIRIQCWINDSIDNVSVKLCEEVSTPGHCTFVQAKSKRYIILVTKNMSRVFIHNVEVFIVSTAMRKHMPRDFFVLLVEDKSLVPPSLIPLKQIPLQDMGENQVFMDWFQRT